MNKVKQVIEFLENKFPKSLAYDWDNVGLQIGDKAAPVKKVLIALDATAKVINEAIENEVDLIITHHPFFFRGVKQIDFQTVQGKKIKKLMEHNISLYSMHTNYDIADGGMNDLLAEKIGLQKVEKFEMINESEGLGRMGTYAHPLPLNDFLSSLKAALKVESVTIAKGNENDVAKVAIIGGSGSSAINEVKALGADIFLTGDVTYHTALDALEMGLNLIDISHYTEVLFQEHVHQLLTGQFGDDIVIQSACTSENPIKLVIL